MPVGPVVRRRRHRRIFLRGREGKFLLRRCRQCGTASEPQNETRPARLHRPGLEAAGGGARVAVGPSPTAAPPGNPLIWSSPKSDEGPWWWTRIIDADPRTSPTVSASSSPSTAPTTITSRSRSFGWRRALSTTHGVDDVNRQLHAEALGAAPGRGRMDGRRIIVVGAGQRQTVDEEPPVGNGRAISVLCARKGPSSPASTSPRSVAEATVDQIVSEAGKAMAAVADVGDASAIGARGGPPLPTGR